MPIGPDEAWKKLTLDQREALETADWVDDVRRRERKETDDFKKRQALAEQYKRKRK